MVKFNWLFRWIEFEWIEIDKCQSLCLIIGQLFHHVTEQFINCSHSEPTSQVSIAVVLGLFICKKKWDRVLRGLWTVKILTPPHRYANTNCVRMVPLTFICFGLFPNLLFKLNICSRNLNISIDYCTPGLFWVKVIIHSTIPGTTVAKPVWRLLIQMDHQ